MGSTVLRGGMGQMLARAWWMRAAGGRMGKEQPSCGDREGKVAVGS